MARARNIKPGFFKNEELVELPFEHRLLFIGLWTLADREGRLEDKPKRIKMEVFPADDVDVDAGLRALHDRKFVVRYSNDEGNFLEICAFKKHQNPHYSEKPSVIKPPDSESTPRVPLVETGVSRADSLNPDSLNPESLSTALSGLAPPSPDASPPEGKNGKPHFAIESREVLAFLNEKAGRRYQANRVNLGFIVSRLKDGATVGECRKVIAKKCREWGSDEKMSLYLRPATLFCARNFAQYQGELVDPQDGPASESNVPRSTQEAAA